MSEQYRMLIPKEGQTRRDVAVWIVQGNWRLKKRLPRLARLAQQPSESELKAMDDYAFPIKD